MWDYGHLPHDLIVRALHATGCGTQLARAAAVSSSWQRAAYQPDLWAERATADLKVAPELLGIRHPKEAYVEALTAETWVWGLLPHGGPCPLPGGASCASSLMAHTASGSRAAAPAKLTHVPSEAGGARGEQEGGEETTGAAAAAEYISAPAVQLQRRGNGSGSASNGSSVASADGDCAVAPRASPVAVAAGEDFVVLLTAGGRVWDSRHAAKHRHPGVQVRDVGAALAGHVVTHIAAGQYHVLALTADGKVFGWGSNSAGQLGLGRACAWVREPTEVTAALRAQWEAAGSDQRVCDIAAGMEHSGLLTSEGTIFLAGRNANGECARAPTGAEHLVEAWAPAELPADAGRAVQLALGWRNTVAITAAGRVLVCGDNSSGQCSPGGTTPPAAGSWADVGPDCRWHGMARKGQAPSGGGGAAADIAVAAAVGRGAVYALTAAGDVYHWGAHPATGRPGSAPAKVPGVQSAVAVVASGAGRFAAAIDASGRLVTWGTGKAGQLGHGGSGGKSVSGREVKALKGRRVVAAACGTDCMVAVTAWAPSRHRSTCRPTASPSPTPCDSERSGWEGSGAAWQGASSPSPWGGEGATSSGVQRGLQAGGRGASGWQAPRTGAGSLAVGAAAGAAPGLGGATDAEPRAGGSGGDSRWRGAAAARAARAAATADARRPRSRNGNTTSSAGPSSAAAAAAGSSGDEGEIGWRTEPLDRAGRVAVRRTLRAFAHDPRARELQMPTGLPAADRQSIHMMAESFGLRHASHGDGDLRTVMVWKSSRTRAWGAPVVPPARGAADGGAGGSGSNGGGNAPGGAAAGQGNGAA